MERKDEDMPHTLFDLELGAYLALVLFWAMVARGGRSRGRGGRPSPWVAD